MLKNTKEIEIVILIKWRSKRKTDKISNDTIVKNNGLLHKGHGINKFIATKDNISKKAFIIVNQTNKIFLISVIVDYL